MRRTKIAKKIAELLYLLSNVYENIQSTDRTLSPFRRCIDALNKSLNISNQLCDANLQTKILSRLTYKYMRDENFRFAQIHAKNALKLLKTHSNITPYSKIKAYRAIAVI